MAVIIEKGDADSARASSYIEHTCQDRHPLLIARLLVSRPPRRSPALALCKVHGDDGPGEGERRDDAAGYEQRLQAEGPDVRDEGNVGIDLPGIARGALC